MPVDAANIDEPSRIQGQGRRKFARVTVAPIGEAAARRLLVAGDRVSGTR